MIVKQPLPCPTPPSPCLDTSAPITSLAQPRSWPSRLELPSLVSMSAKHDASWRRNGIHTQAIANYYGDTRHIHYQRRPYPYQHSRQSPEQIQLRQHAAKSGASFVSRIQREPISSASPGIDSNDILNDCIYGRTYRRAFRNR